MVFGGPRRSASTCRYTPPPMTPVGKIGPGGQQTYGYRPVLADGTSLEPSQSVGWPKGPAAKGIEELGECRSPQTYR